MKNLSILISTYNRTECLKNTLLNICNQDYQKELIDIIVFDDASTDNTKNEIPIFLKNIKNRYGFKDTNFFHSETNIGIAAARSFLVDNLVHKTEVLLFLDDDVYLTQKDSLTMLIDFLSKNQNIGAIGPKIVLASNPNQIIQSAIFINKWTGSYYMCGSVKPINCDAIDPLCIMVPLNTFIAVKGFSKELYRSHEGIDFCLKIKNTGYDVLYFPLVTVQHDTKPGYPSKERLYYLYRNKLIVVKKHFNPLQILSVFLLTIIFRIPIYIFKSYINNKRFILSEIKIILTAIKDGIIGKTGKNLKIIYANNQRTRRDI